MLKTNHLAIILIQLFHLILLALRMVHCSMQLKLLQLRVLYENHFYGVDHLMSFDLQYKHDRSHQTFYNAKIIIHLLKYDTTQGRFNREVRIEDNQIIVDDHKIQICYFNSHCKFLSFICFCFNLHIKYS